MSLHKWRIKRKERAVVVKILIANINNKATGMLYKSEPLEAYPSKGFRWNRVDAVGMKQGVVWTRGTHFPDTGETGIIVQCGQDFSRICMELACLVE